MADEMKKPTTDATPVPKQELEAVRKEERQGALTRALGAVARPVLAVCDPVLRVCYNAFGVVAGPLKIVTDPVRKVCYEPIAGRFSTHYHKKYRTRFPRYAKALFIFDLALLAVIGSLITFALFADRLLPAVTVPTLVRLEATAPETIVSGKETTFTVSFSNDSASELGCAEIDVRLPAGTKVLDDVHAMNEENDAFCVAYGYSTAAFSDTARPDVVTFRLGTVPADGRGTVQFKAIPFGPTGSTKVLSAELRYWEEAKTSPSRVALRREWEVSDSALALGLELPPQLVRGRAETVTLTYENGADAAFPDATLTLTPPEDFVVTGSSTAQSGRNSWRLADLAPGRKGSIEVYGYFRAVASKSAPNFTLSATALIDGKSRMVESVRKNADARAADIELTQVLEQPAGRETAFEGETMRVAVQYRNAGSQTVRNLSIAVDPGAAYVNRLSPATLSWNPATNPELASVAPGASGSFIAEFAVSEPLTPALLGDDEAPQLFVASRAEYEREGEAGRPIRVDTETTRITVATKMTIKATALYYTTDGDQLGIGPLPPKVGEQTKYRVLMSIENTTGDAEDVIVEATLPAGAEWGGRSVVTAGDAVDYLPSTRKIRWAVGKVPAYAGDDGTRIGASFEIIVTPTENEVGAPMALLEDIKMAGNDVRTGLRLTGAAERITTDLPYDRRAAGKGAVVK